MRTNQLNILEAINYAMAGHRVRLINEAKATHLFCDNGELKLTLTASLNHPNVTDKRLDGRDFKWLRDCTFNVGDDRTIKGFF